jgi:iron complex transport system permease protein
MSFKNFILLIATLLMALFLLFYGEVGFTNNSELLWQIRMPKIVSCFFAGGMLATAGLLMQIFFQNPLAGPDILGVSSGSSLFVALWMLVGASLNPIFLSIGVSAMSFLGAMSVFALLLFLIHKNLSRVSLIIVGLLISSFASSCISLLVNLSSASSLKNFLMWSMGSFRNLTLVDLPEFIFFSMLAIIPLIFIKKPLNQFLLSEHYAQSMGVNVKKMKYVFVTMAALMISIVTHFCGPVGFIGIISPHLARHFHKRSNLDQLLPASFFMGAILAFLAEIILVLLPESLISVNAILGIIGAPLIVYFIAHQRDLK